MVDLKAEPGTSLSFEAIKEAVEAHKPAVLFLVQVRMCTLIEGIEAKV